jgi:hypothetical protein
VFLFLVLHELTEFLKFLVMLRCHPYELLDGPRRLPNQQNDPQPALEQNGLSWAYNKLLKTGERLSENRMDVKRKISRFLLEAGDMQGMRLHPCVPQAWGG